MTAPRTIGIGILGFGTVGQGVWKHLHEKQADLESRLGVKLDLRKASVRDLKKKRAVKISTSKLTSLWMLMLLPSQVRPPHEHQSYL